MCPQVRRFQRIEIITLLQNGVADNESRTGCRSARCEFRITPQIAREIKEAGGNNALIGAITAKASEAPAAPSNAVEHTARRAVPAGPDYDDLDRQGSRCDAGEQSLVAINLLQQAVNVDSSKPQAYGLLGFAQLYGSHDIACG